MSARGYRLGSLTLLVAACGESTPPPAVVPPPSESSVSAESAPGASASAHETKEWQAPERATKEVVRKECGPLLEALHGTAKGEPAEIDKAVREKLDALSQDPPIPPAPFAWCKAQFLTELDRFKERPPAKEVPQRGP